MPCRVPRLHPSQSPGLSIPSPAFSPPDSFQHPRLHHEPSRRGEKHEPHRATARVSRGVRRVCRAVGAYGNGMIILRCRCVRGADSVVQGWITETGWVPARAPSAAPAASASASGRRSSRRRRCCSCQLGSSSSATPPSGTCVFFCSCQLKVRSGLSNDV